MAGTKIATSDFRVSLKTDQQMGFLDIFRRPKSEPQYGSLPAGKRRAAVVVRPTVVARADEWQPGQIPFEDFVVEGVLGEGGMGKVYLVKSHSTDMRFAVKRAKGLSQRERRNFLAELQTWIDLPEHPNLVPCRFFRTVGDEVLIFAEYVAGGSLKNWIDSRKLYGGGAEQALNRILDTAIQFAWGLHCVHELGLVHQDVKPANVMMEKDAHVVMQGLKARVTDYGLARARAIGGERDVAELGRSILVSSGGFTPAYCSPEQAGGRKLDRRTDVWSWGVSVMEMFQGGVTWQSGMAAAEALKTFLEHNGEEEHISAIPVEVAELLKGCFRKDPAQRWESFEDVVQKLRGVYHAVVGAEYSRALGKIEPKAARQVRADERRARSGVSWTDPQEWLERALLAEGRDPAEAAEIVARQGSSRRGQLVADVATYDEARRIYERLIEGGRKDLENTMAALCQQAAFVHETADDSSGASVLYDRAIEILDRMVNVEGRRELAKDLASVYVNKGIALKTTGNNREAVELFDQAIAIGERMGRQSGGSEGLTNLANTYMNKANAVTNLGDYREAVLLFDLAIQILELAVGAPNNRKELLDGLASAYINKAIALNAFGDIAEAGASYDRGLNIYERLVNQEGRRELSDRLSAAYMNKATVLGALGDNAGAIVLYDRAIEINARLINQEGRRELSRVLALVYQNKAAALIKLGDKAGAAAVCDPAISIYERLVHQEGRRDLSQELSSVYLNKGIALQELADDAGAVAYYDRALQITERLVNSEGRRELFDSLANIYNSKAGATCCMGDEVGGLLLFDRAIQIRERLVNEEGRQELAYSLAKTYVNKSVALSWHADNQGAVASYDSAISIYEKLINQQGRKDLMAELAGIKGYRANNASAILRK